MVCKTKRYRVGRLLLQNCQTFWLISIQWALSTLNLTFLLSETHYCAKRKVCDLARSPDGPGQDRPLKRKKSKWRFRRASGHWTRETLLPKNSSLGNFSFHKDFSSAQIVQLWLTRALHLFWEEPLICNSFDQRRIQNGHQRRLHLRHHRQPLQVFITTSIP